jgi:hypothetical protein
VQLHIFIFVVAMTHVTMGVLMILLSSWRVRGWRRITDQEDEHTRA